MRLREAFILFVYFCFVIISSDGWGQCESRRRPLLALSQRSWFILHRRISCGPKFLTRCSARPDSGGVITDWVVQNLEGNNSTITSRSTVKAGENDTLPEEGLVIGNLRILASDSSFSRDDANPDILPIRLLVGRNGWGTGVHPTTRLCLEWLCQTIRGDETVLDYGCGSGILSIAALRLGAKKCYGVDVEAEALVTAVRNVQMNLINDSSAEDVRPLFEPFHTREVLPFGIHSPTGVDICVANILIGQLLRPSMVVTLMSNLATDGLLCLSGIRPGDQVDSLRAAYGPHVAWIAEDYAELAAAETPSSIDSYGFDCGVWCRLVGRKTATQRSDEIAAMSESAVA
jgi:SAM-dependent methyltransferase